MSKRGADKRSYVNPVEESLVQAKHLSFSVRHSGSDKRYYEKPRGYGVILNPDYVTIFSQPSTSVVEAPQASRTHPDSVTPVSADHTNHPLCALPPSDLEMVRGLFDFKKPAAGGGLYQRKKE